MMKIRALPSPWLKKLRPDVWTLLLIGMAIYFWFRPPAWIADQDKPLPAFEVQLVDGRTVSSETLRGKVVLVNFWATWCPFCRHEMPDMEKFYQGYKGDGFEILALSIDDHPDIVRQFMTKEAYSFPAAMTNSSVANAFGSVTRVPVSYVIDKEGVIRKKITGQVHYARLEEVVIPLLKR